MGKGTRQDDASGMITRNRMDAIHDEEFVVVHDHVEDDFVQIKQEKTDLATRSTTRESKLMSGVPVVMPLKLTIDDLASVHKEVGLNFTTNSGKRKKLLSLTQQQRKQQMTLETAKISVAEEARIEKEKLDAALAKNAKPKEADAPAKASAPEKDQATKTDQQKKDPAATEEDNTEHTTAPVKAEKTVEAKQNSTPQTKDTAAKEAMEKARQKAAQEGAKQTVREHTYRTLTYLTNTDILLFAKKGETPFDALANNYAEIKKLISRIPDYEEEIKIRRERNKSGRDGLTSPDELDKAEAKLRTLKDLEAHFSCVEEIMSNKYYAYLSMEEMKNISTKELRSRYADLFKLPRLSDPTKAVPGQKYRNEELVRFYESLIRFRETAFQEGKTAKEREEEHLATVKKEQAKAAAPVQKKEELKPEEPYKESKDYYANELKRITEAYSDLKVFLEDPYAVVSKEQYRREFFESFRLEECRAGYRSKNNGSEGGLPRAVTKFLKEFDDEQKKRAEAKPVPASKNATDVKAKKAEGESKPDATKADSQSATDVKANKVEGKPEPDADKANPQSTAETKKTAPAPVVSKLTDKQREAVHAAGTLLTERSLHESKKGAYIRDLKFSGPVSGFGFVPGTSIVAPPSSTVMPQGSIPLRSEWKSHVPFVFNMLKNSPDQLLIAYYLLENDKQDDATGIDFLTVRDTYQPDLEKIKKISDWAKISRALRSSSQISSWLTEFDARKEIVKKMESEPPANVAAPQTVTKTESSNPQAGGNDGAGGDTEKQVKQTKNASGSPAGDGDGAGSDATEKARAEELRMRNQTVTTTVSEEQPAEMVKPVVPLVRTISEGGGQSKLNARTLSGMGDIYEPQGPNNCYCCTGTAMINQFIAKRKRAAGTGNGTITEFCDQYNMRAYRPAVRTFDSVKGDGQNGSITQENYDNTIRALDEYAGSDKKEVGSIFEMGDFILDELHKQHIDDVMLHNVSFSLPADQAKFEEMKQLFINKVKELLETDHVVGCLRHGHYVTITGIDETKEKPVFMVYNSLEYKELPVGLQERDIDEFIDMDTTMELDWISDREEPQSLTNTFHHLKHDGNPPSFSVDKSHADFREAERMNHFHIVHTKGVTVSRIIEQAPGQDSLEGATGVTPQEALKKEASSESSVTTDTAKATQTKASDAAPEAKAPAQKNEGGVIIESVYIPQKEAERHAEADQPVEAERSVETEHSVKAERSVKAEPSVISLDQSMAGVHQRDVVKQLGIKNLNAIEQRIMMIQMLYQSAGLHADMPINMVEDLNLRKRITNECLELQKLNEEWRKQLIEKNLEASELDVNHHVKKGKSALEKTNAATSYTQEYGNKVVGGTLKGIGAGGQLIDFARTAKYVDAAAIIGGTLSFVGLLNDIVSSFSLAYAGGLTKADLAARAVSLGGSYAKDVGGFFSAAGSMIAATKIGSDTSTESVALTWLKDSSKNLITHSADGSWATITGGVFGLLAGAAMMGSATVEIIREESSKNDVKAARKILNARKAAEEKAEKEDEKRAKEAAEEKAKKAAEKPKEEKPDGAATPAPGTSTAEHKEVSSDEPAKAEKEKEKEKGKEKEKEKEKDQDKEKDKDKDKDKEKEEKEKPKEASTKQTEKKVIVTKRLTPEQKKQQKDFEGLLDLQTTEIERKEAGSAVKMVNGCLVGVAGGLAMTGFLAPIGAILGLTAMFLGTGAKICDWIQKNENRDMAVDKYLGLEKKMEEEIKKLPVGTLMDEKEYRIRIRDMALAENGYSSVKECFRQICFEYAALLYSKVFLENPPPEDIEMYRRGMQSLGMKMNDRAAVANGEKPIPSIEAMVTKLMS